MARNCKDLVSTLLKKQPVLRKSPVRNCITCPSLDYDLEDPPPHIEPVAIPYHQVTRGHQQVTRGHQHVTREETTRTDLQSSYYSDITRDWHKYHNHTAIESLPDNISHTYGELSSLAVRFAWRLTSLGFQPGGSVGVTCFDNPHYPVILLATLLAGGKPVAIRSRAKTEEILRTLQQNKSSIFCGSDSLIRELTPALHSSCPSFLSAINISDIHTEDSATGHIPSAHELLSTTVQPGVMMMQQRNATSHAAATSSHTPSTIDPRKKKPALNIVLAPMFKADMILEALLKYLQAGSKVIMLPSYDPCMFKKTLQLNRLEDRAVILLHTYDSTH